MDQNSESLFENAMARYQSGEEASVLIKDFENRKFDFIEMQTSTKICEDHCNGFVVALEEVSTPQHSTFLFS